MRRYCRVRLPPLCKGRWGGVSRLGGVVFLVAHIHLLRQHDRRMQRKPLKKGGQCPPLRYGFLYRPRFGKRNGQAHSLQGAGKAFAPNQHNFTESETLWFVPLSRYRASAKNVYVHSQSASEKTTPQSASLTAPLTQGRQGKCGSFAVSSAISIPGCRNSCISTVSVRL